MCLFLEPHVFSYIWDEKRLLKFIYFVVNDICDYVHHISEAYFRQRLVMNATADVPDVGSFLLK